MSKYKCNSCGGVYSDHTSDGMDYYHVCPPEKVVHAEFDADGKVLTAEKRVPHENPRDERTYGSAIVVDQKLYWFDPDPTGDKPFILTPFTPRIRKEGAGRTLVE